MIAEEYAKEAQLSWAGHQENGEEIIGIPQTNGWLLQQETKNEHAQKTKHPPKKQ